MSEQMDIRSDFFWALVPEWVLYADISANAVRLYAVLARHADKDTKQCHPTRQTLAGYMKASRATVDRALDELVQIGAVAITQRKTPKGDWTSNSYLVRSIPPRGVSSRVNTPIITGDETGLLTGAEQTRVSINQSHERGRRAKGNAGDKVAKDWWEAQTPKPVGKGAWHALLAVCRAAVDRGWDGDKIRAALDAIGTVPSAAQLDRELRGKRPETWTERKNREEREERDRIAAKREAERIESAERLRQLEKEREEACPPPPEFRQMVARLQGRAS